MHNVTIKLLLITNLYLARILEFFDKILWKRKRQNTSPITHFKQNCHFESCFFSACGAPNSKTYAPFPLNFSCSLTFFYLFFSEKKTSISSFFTRYANFSLHFKSFFWQSVLQSFLYSNDRNKKTQIYQLPDFC